MALPGSAPFYCVPQVAEVIHPLVTAAIFISPVILYHLLLKTFAGVGKTILRSQQFYRRTKGRVGRKMGHKLAISQWRTLLRPTIYTIQ